MHLSESFRKNIFEPAVGSVFNNFKIHRRRDVFFFEDLTSEYIRLCENSGHADDMYLVGKDGGYLIIRCLIPDMMRSLSRDMLINVVMRTVWLNLGVMADISLESSGENMVITTKNESLTRIIGSNRFNEGLYSGIISALYECDARLVKSSQTKETSTYEYSCSGSSPYTISFKPKGDYMTLNRMPVTPGYSLSDALRYNQFSMDGNIISFRGHMVSPIENTFFHLTGIRNIMLDAVPSISYGYFSRIIGESTPENKLLLLKNILQAMGWGVIGISLEPANVTFTIKYPPIGLQEKDDNWHYLSRVIEGYLWLIDRKYSIRRYAYNNRTLSLSYSMS